MATNTTGNKIKTMIASGNVGQCSSKEFDNFLTSKGIAKQRSIAKTPEQNGIAERMNRAVQETARSMQHAAELSAIFLG